MNKKFIYSCVTCSAEYPGEGVHYRCPSCAKSDVEGQPHRGMLKVEYSQWYKFKGSPEERLSFLQNEGFLSLLPIQNLKSLGYLRVGNTPVYTINMLDAKVLPFQLMLKDDSQNPTFSFKDRASAMVSAFAKENGKNILLAASTGNAGSSLAGICASQGQKAIILAPAAAPIAKLTQIIMYGALLIAVDGNYDAAFDLSVQLTEKYGWYNRNTAYNPITTEGKKTVAFEIVSQFLNELPDRIYVPCGDGVILCGVYKGFEDLLNMGIIDKIPVIIAVQAEGSDNLLRNFYTDTFVAKPSATRADSISVDIPRNFYMAKHYHLKYQGENVTVSDQEIMEASATLSRNTGIFSEPAAAAAFAGMLKNMSEGRIPEQSRNLILLTGSGLKDVNFVRTHVLTPQPVKADLGSVSRFLEKNGYLK